ncbi:hypothetical protein QC761_0111040 [Podospora bellae-mahoneyi]|uniref:BHLH domain-containing protein n=1 Tax=Podospora bellae-mahoneyi TaxID=2093777 RepID=A0ABR0F6R3_9PEZI|nr:hypothetical protein QC761_0111040 [Podospora bellae-mahoneyi]
MTFRTLQLPRSAPAPPAAASLPRAVTSVERARRNAQNAAAFAALRATLPPPSRQSAALASLAHCPARAFLFRSGADQEEEVVEEG